MKDFQSELADSKQKFKSEIAKGKWEFFTNMVSADTNKFLADYKAQYDETRHKQHQEDLRRRRCLLEDVNVIERSRTT